MKLIKNLSLFILLFLGIIFLSGCGNEKVSITFDVDGGSSVDDIIELDLDEDFVLPITEKENYVFLGWHFGFEKMDTESIKFYFNRDKNFTEINLIAKWEIEKFNVKFYDGDKLVMEEVVEYNQSAQSAQSALDYKLGHTFLKWDTDFSNVTEDLEIHAIWEKNSYTIKYLNYDNSILKEYEILFNENLDFIIAPEATRKGYDFLRWNVELPNTMPAEDLIINAEYGIASFTISFIENGGSKVDSINQGFGTSVIKPVDPIKLGNTFLGWYLDEELTEAYTFSKMPNEDITLYAKWDVKKYKLTFLNDDLTVLEELTIEFNQNLDSLIGPNPIKNGYKFIGWDQELPDTMPSHDIVLLAEYTIKQYTIFFIVNGGSEVESIVQNYNTLVNKPLDPNRLGFIFVGWYKDAELLESYTFSTMPYENTTIYAKWEVDESVIGEFENYMIEQLTGDIESDVTLPTSYSSLSVNWSSNNENVLSSSGKYNRPYLKLDVILTAYFEYNSESRSIVFETSIKGYKVLEPGIASSYIYRQYTNVTDDYFDILDIINCAFITANSSGILSGSSYLNNVSRYIIPKAKQNGVWVVMSVAPDSSWSTIAASPTLVENFANNIVSMINQYGFDGVDIDWETPTNSESESFVALARKVSEKVKANNPNHLVTAAIGGGMWQPPRYNLKDSGKYLDFVNMMTYGMVTNNGYYQNALYPSSSFDNTTNSAGKTLGSCSISESVAIYSSFNIPYEKIIVGLAFYGIKQSRTYDAVNQSWSGWVKASSPHYHTIINNYVNNSNYEVHFDNIAKVPYILKKDGTEFISYDNHESIIAKSNYILNQNLGGLMFWESGTDTTNTLLASMGEGLGKVKLE